MLSILVVALLAQSAAGPESEWAAPPSRPAAPPPRPAPAAPNPARISEEAKGSYRRALELISRGDHTGATEILNKLGLENPKWGAVFAARCTAQVGLQYFQNAIEDCTYALSLDASASPIWWLAEAEAALNHRDDAARHYRQYAASSAADVTPANRERAERRAVALESPAPRPTAPAVAERPAPPPPPPAPAPPVVIVVPAPYGSRAAPQYQAEVPDCRFSSDCGDGPDFSCRAWRGHRVCMGHGGPGAPCWFSSDCVSDSCDGSSKTCR